MIKRFETVEHGFGKYSEKRWIILFDFIFVA